MELQGAVCLVTGAASGIGAALTDELERAGAALVATIDVREAPETSRIPGRLPVRADVSSVDELRAAFDAVTNAAGRLDIVFNNAGILGSAWPAQAPESVMRLASVNLGGVMAGTRLALDAMTSGGVIVNTASKTGLFEHPDGAAYAATKAGIIHFTRCCASLFATHGVRVNAVLPGMTATSLFDTAAGAGQSAAAPGRPLLEPTAIARVMLEVAADDAMEPGSSRLADQDTIGQRGDAEAEPLSRRSDR